MDAASNVAVTVAAAFIVTTHAPVPVHAPDHPVNDDEASAVAVNVTAVPKLYGSEQSAPQVIPAGVDVTLPTPPPARTTVSVLICNVKVAETVVAAVIVTTQLPVPLHPPPDQPVKVEPTVEAAESVTTVPKL